MAYKVIDIYKDLPHRSGCDGCGRPGCFAFATAVHLEGVPLTRCPHLSPEQLALMEAKVKESRALGEGPRESPEAQAATSLQEELDKNDLAELAERSGVRHVPGPPEALEVELLGRTYQLRRDEVVANDGEAVEVWIKVVLLMYVTRASGVPPLGEWVAYRDLPNTISKQKTFEKWVDRLAVAYEGRLDELEGATSVLGGEAILDPSAQRAFRLQLLPRVPALLLVWDSDEDFPPRGSLLLDRGVLDYLDQEALTFLAEALMRRLLAEP